MPFQKCLSSSAHESCADSLTCHHKSWVFAEGKLKEKQSFFPLFFFFSPSQPATDKFEHIDLH